MIKKENRNSLKTIFAEAVKNYQKKKLKNSRKLMT